MRRVSRSEASDAACMLNICQGGNMRFKSAFGLAVISAFVLAMPAWSHHSHGNYVTDSFMDLQGVVKEVHLVVPHSWVYLEVKDAAGEPQIWALEATGRTGLESIG